MNHRLASPEKTEKDLIPVKSNPFMNNFSTMQ